MSQATDSHIYKHWQNEHEWRNEQDNWLPHLQVLSDWTWKIQWARQLTPTSTSTSRMNMKDAISKTTDSHIYKYFQNENERCNEQVNWLPHLQAQVEWIWKPQWPRQLTPTSTSTGRMNTKDAMNKTTDSHTYKHWMQDTMSKTTNSNIYRHWKNEHEISNEQDNLLPHLQALTEWTWKTQWERKTDTHI